MPAGSSWALNQASMPPAAATSAPSAGVQPPVKRLSTCSASASWSVIGPIGPEVGSDVGPDGGAGGGGAVVVGGRWWCLRRRRRFFLRRRSAAADASSGRPASRPPVRAAVAAVVVRSRARVRRDTTGSLVATAPSGIRSPARSDRFARFLHRDGTSDREPGNQAADQVGPTGEAYTFCTSGTPGRYARWTCDGA